MRRLGDHDPKLVAALGTGSGDIPGMMAAGISQRARASQLVLWDWGAFQFNPAPRKFSVQVYWKNRG